jgi:hypothetical protein
MRKESWNFARGSAGDSRKKTYLLLFFLQNYIHCCRSGPKTSFTRTVDQLAKTDQSDVPIWFRINSDWSVLISWSTVSNEIIRMCAHFLQYRYNNFCSRSSNCFVLLYFFMLIIIFTPTAWSEYVTLIKIQGRRANRLHPKRLPDLYFHFLVCTKIE